MIQMNTIKKTVGGFRQSFLRKIGIKIRIFCKLYDSLKKYLILT